MELSLIIEALRLIFGSVFVLFVPGFALSWAFFPKKDIDWIERIALSFALSIAVVPLAIFYLNRFVGVKIDLVNSVIIVSFLTVLGAVVWYLRTKKPIKIKVQKKKHHTKMKI